MPRFKKTSRLTHRKHERKSKSATSGSEETDMVARKSSRVKKSPVVYQAPEPSSRVGRPSGSAKQPVIHRRIFGKDVDLQMECVEDELSPAQVKAMKEAQQEHDKANEMIKEVRAGNILVPSSQPNTFTIVPPKTSQTIPPAANLQQAPPPQQQMPPPAPPVPVEEAGVGVGHQGVPPPRPAQFLNKHVSEMKVTKPTQDVIVISSSAAPVGVKLTSTTQTVPTLQLQMAPMNSQGTIQAASLVPVSRNVPGGVMPQQVYKFVSLPSSIQTNVVHNQWALRPLLTVSPQQQSSVMGSNPQVLQHFAMTTTTAQKLGMRLAAPRPQQATGEELKKVGRSKSAGRWSLGETNRLIGALGSGTVGRKHHKVCRVYRVPWDKFYSWSSKHKQWKRSQRNRKTKINARNMHTVEAENLQSVTVHDRNPVAEVKHSSTFMQKNCHYLQIERKGHVTSNEEDRVTSTEHICNTQNLYQYCCKFCSVTNSVEYESFDKLLKETLISCGISTKSETLNHFGQFNVLDKIDNHIRVEDWLYSHNNITSELLENECRESFDSNVDNENVSLSEEIMSDCSENRFNSVNTSESHLGLKTTFVSKYICDTTPSATVDVAEQSSHRKVLGDLSNRQSHVPRVHLKHSKCKGCEKVHDKVKTFNKENMTKGEKCLHANQSKVHELDPVKEKNIKRREKEIYRDLCRDISVPPSVGIVNMVYETSACKGSPRPGTVTDSFLSSETSISENSEANNNIQGKPSKTTSNETGSKVPLCPKPLEVNHDVTSEHSEQGMEKLPVTKTDSRQFENESKENGLLMVNRFLENSSQDDSWSDLSGDISDCSVDTEVSETFSGSLAQSHGKDRLYEQMLIEDKQSVIALCGKYGFTRMSKELQIPKTVLLKWRRIVKRHHAGKKEGSGRPVSVDTDGCSVLKKYYPAWHAEAALLVNNAKYAESTASSYAANSSGNQLSSEETVTFSKLLGQEMSVNDNLDSKIRPAVSDKVEDFKEGKETVTLLTKDSNRGSAELGKSRSDTGEIGEINEDKLSDSKGIKNNFAFCLKEDPLKSDSQKAKPSNRLEEMIAKLKSSFTGPEIVDDTSADKVDTSCDESEGSDVGSLVNSYESDEEEEEEEKEEEEEENENVDDIDSGEDFTGQELCGEKQQKNKSRTSDDHIGGDDEETILPEEKAKIVQKLTENVEETGQKQKSSRKNDDSDDVDNDCNSERREKRSCLELGDSGKQMEHKKKDSKGQTNDLDILSGNDYVNTVMPSESVDVKQKNKELSESSAYRIDLYGLDEDSESRKQRNIKSLKSLGTSMKQEVAKEFESAQVSREMLDDDAKSSKHSQELRACQAEENANIEAVNEDHCYESPPNCNAENNEGKLTVEDVNTIETEFETDTNQSCEESDKINGVLEASLPFTGYEHFEGRRISVVKCIQPKKVFPSFKRGIPAHYLKSDEGNYKAGALHNTSTDFVKLNSNTNNTVTEDLQKGSFKIDKNFVPGRSFQYKDMNITERGKTVEPKHVLSCNVEEVCSSDTVENCTENLKQSSCVMPDQKLCSHGVNDLSESESRFIMMVTNSDQFIEEKDIVVCGSHQSSTINQSDTSGNPSVSSGCRQVIQKILFVNEDPDDDYPFTESFLKFVYEKKLLRLSPVEPDKESNAMQLLKDIYEHETVIKNQSFKIYGPKLKRCVVVAVLTYGINLVAKELKMTKTTLLAWRNLVLNLLQGRYGEETIAAELAHRNTNNDVKKKLEKKQSAARQKDFACRKKKKMSANIDGMNRNSSTKRVVLSTHLKVKLLTLAKKFGKTSVSRQYNISIHTLGKWAILYRDVKLPSYELQEGDLLELVEHNRYKEEVLSKKAVKGEQNKRLKEVQETEKKVSENRTDSEVAATDSTVGETDLSEKQQVAIKANSEVAVPKDLARENSLNCMMKVFPSNTEVIIDSDNFDDDDDNKEAGCNTHMETAGSRVAVSKENTAKDDTIRGSALDIELTTSNPEEPNSEQSEKNATLGEDSSLLETVRNDIELFENDKSENDTSGDEIEELISWAVTDIDTGYTTKEKSENLNNEVKESENINVFSNKNVLSEHAGDRDQVKEKCNKNVHVELCILDNGEKTSVKQVKKDISWDKSGIGKKTEEQVKNDVKRNTNRNESSIAEKTEKQVKNDVKRKAEMNESGNQLKPVRELSKRVHGIEPDSDRKPVHKGKKFNETTSDVISSTGICSKEVIAIEDEDSNEENKISKLPFKLLSPADIKDEPVDEEFDALEQGRKPKKVSYGGREDSFENSNKMTGKSDVFINSPAEVFTCRQKSGNRESFAKDAGVVELGIGDGNTGQSQGFSFHGSSGNMNAGSQSSSISTAAGFASTSGSQASRLPVDFPNVQIVGTQDLIPGQEYILVDPRILTSGSNTLQNLRPPTLLRPQLRSPVSNAVQVSYTPQISTSSARNVPNRMPTPVHMVENRSLKATPPGIPVVSVRPQVSSYLQDKSKSNDSSVNLQPQSEVSTPSVVGLPNLPPLSMYGRSSTVSVGPEIKQPVSNNSSFQIKKATIFSGSSVRGSGISSGSIVIVSPHSSSSGTQTFVTVPSQEPGKTTQLASSILNMKKEASVLAYPRKGTTFVIETVHPKGSSSSSPASQTIAEALRAAKSSSPRVSEPVQTVTGHSFQRFQSVTEANSQFHFIKPTVSVDVGMKTVTVSSVLSAAKSDSGAKSFTLSGVGSLSGSLTSSNVEMPGQSGIQKVESHMIGSGHQECSVQPDCATIQTVTMQNRTINPKQFLNSEAVLQEAHKMLTTYRMNKSHKTSNEKSDPLPESLLKKVLMDDERSQVEALKRKSEENKNRIGSLIERMTSRVVKKAEDLQLDTTMMALELTKPTKPPGLSESEPTAASEILFGGLSPTKSADRDTRRASGSSLSSEVDSNTSSVPSQRRVSRKQPLTTRVIDSTEEESSNSSSNSSEYTTASAESAEETSGMKQGTVEKVDLSEKLKTLLSADIFSIVDEEKEVCDEEDDLMQLLAQPSEKSSSSKIGELTRASTANSSFEKGAPAGEAVTPKKTISYSLNIKKKLGKLATMFSITSLSKKYGINTQTLSNWKRKFQDEEIAGLSLTEEELKEIEEMRELKKKMFGSSEDVAEYDIYVDNPEDEKLENLIFIGKEMRSGEKVEKGKMGSVSVDNLSSKPSDNIPVKTSIGNRPAWSSKPKTSVPSSLTKKELSKDGAPLYIELDENTPEEVKKQLRTQIKGQKNVEQYMSSQSAFLEFSGNKASVFGDTASDKPQSLKSIFGASQDSQTGNKPVGITGMASTPRSRILSGEKEKTGVTWERTVYLCPDEGIFKYRYEMKKGVSDNSSEDRSEGGKPMNVLDSLFGTENERKDEGSEQQISSASTTDTGLTSTASIASILKDAPNTPALPESGTRVWMTPPKMLSSSVAGPLVKPGSGVNTGSIIVTQDDPYSEAFKWAVVKEARKSGFESTAKWYNISMTDIMKWHDMFLHEKQNQDVNLDADLSGTIRTAPAVASAAQQKKLLPRKEPNLAGIPGKGRSGRINASLSFERIQGREGSITKPKFNSQQEISEETLEGLKPINRQNRTRMGPNSIKFAGYRPNPHQLQRFQEDIRGDLGIMPKLVKESQSRDGVEIASTWKQVQSVLNPAKPNEKKYSQEFKNRIIKECEKKGQKTVAVEHRIPYNEISRWRLEAKKAAAQTPKPKPSAGQPHPALTERPVTASSEFVTATGFEMKRSLSEPDTLHYAVQECHPSGEQEPLKIRIKLSNIGQTSPATLSSKKKTTESYSESKNVAGRSAENALQVHKSSTLNVARKSTTPGHRHQSKPKAPEDSARSSASTQSGSVKSVRTERDQSVDMTPVAIDGDNDHRMEVINFCFDHGVLKTQKKYNVTRQSIIDLMKEYDELSKYAADSYSKSQGLTGLKTKLVSREKTSVEVTNTATQPVIVKNLNDYIVTQEYKESVVQYALKHGMTAASRKYKRKNNTVRTWIKEFQREKKKSISVQQMAKEQELMAANMTIEEAKKISNLEAKRKKMLLEAEFRRHIIEFAREFGITAASRRFKKKAATVKSWMGHLQKSERDAKRQEAANKDKEQSELMKVPASLPVTSSPGLSFLPTSSASQKQKTPPESPLWEQDYVIKPSTGKSPLKLTFSPRRKSSPVIVIGSSADEDTIEEEETNDIETDEEEANVSSEFLEVAAWELNASGESNKSGTPLKYKDVRGTIDLVRDNENNKSDKAHGNDTFVDLVSDDEKDSTRSPAKKRVKELPTGGKYVKEDSNKSPGVFISPTEVPNILDEFVTEAEKNLDGITEQTGLSQESATNAPESVTEEHSHQEEEDECPVVPYEESMMFRLFTDDVDNFFSDETAVIRAKKETPVHKLAKKTDQVKESEEGKVKKFKRYADAEILLNIEDTVLFTEGRSTRNTSNRDSDLNSSYGSGMLEIDHFGAVHKESPYDNEENQEGTPKMNVLSADEISDDGKITQEDKEQETQQRPVPVVDSLLEEKTLDENKKKQGDKKLETPQRQERSLFDFLVTDSETDSKPIEEETEKAKHSGQSESRSEKTAAPISLFGNIMKGLKLSQAAGIGVKSAGVSTSDEVAAKDSKQTTATKLDLSVTSKNAEADAKPKERGERNLFDFMIPDVGQEPVKSLEEPKQDPAPTLPASESPRIMTRSHSRNAASPNKTPTKPSPVKGKALPFTGGKKPMFKFPKLALPVNFGNIAKLGLAKLKEEQANEGKDQGETDVVAVDGKNRDEGRKADGISKEHDKSSEQKPARKNSDKVKNETKDEVIMETFEELRQRLAKQRAAVKQAKEREAENAESKHEETVKDSDEKTEIVTKAKIETVELDEEMYKEFTPEKIVLILGISKKHGIEFASSSFGLPVSVIVNWIIEKDRKHRKSALSVSLEEKLRTLKDRTEGKMSIEEIMSEHEVDRYTIERWDDEFGWLIKDKRVCDVVEKWKKVETVTNINFEECEKNLERRDSAAEKERPYEKHIVELEMQETSITDNEIGEKVFEGSLGVPKKQLNTSQDSVICSTGLTGNSQPEDDNDVIIVDSSEGSKEIYKQDSENVQSSESTKETEVQEGAHKEPDVLSFLKTLKVKEFTIEHKAQLVLLCDRYGQNLVSKKLGVNSGTLFNWIHHDQIRNYIFEHSGLKKFKVVVKQSDQKQHVNAAEKRIEEADFVPVRETRSVTEKRLASNKVAKKSTSKAAAGKKDDHFSHPTGYRVISPTKLPPSLKDIKPGQTKEYTLEQKVAIVKLVQLYGVRTIHKQFRIPQASVWNWQHQKAVMDELKKEDAENESLEARRELDFESDDDEEEVITIDTILDRTLVASDIMNPINFKLDQRADVLCLIQHFGVEYVCEKMPQVPRGTLWNWRHNKTIAAIAEKRMEDVKRFADSLRRESVIVEAADKRDWTQKWVKDIQEKAGRKRSGEKHDDSVESAKRKKIDNKQDSHKQTKQRSISPSTISSEISVHSNDYEEIWSDDEANTPSVVSKRSGTSSHTGKNRTCKSEQKTSKGSVTGKPDCASVSSEKDSEKTEETSRPFYEVLKIEIKEDDQMMVCYKPSEGREIAQMVRSADFGNKRPASAEPLGEPAAKKRMNKGEVQDGEGNWIPLDEYYYGTLEGDPEYTEEKGEYRFKCWYCSKMLYNNVRAMQHIQGHIDASKQQNIDLSDLTQCKHCYKQFDTPFEMQTHVEKVHLSNKVLMCRICERDFTTQRELTVHMKTNHHACEMPYICQLCSFRSSMYSDVVDHFKKKHDSSHYFLCLYCLRTFEVKFVSQGWGQTQTYYGHLLKHQTKSSTKKCVVCRLTFFNAMDVKTHRKNCHLGNQLDLKASNRAGKTEPGQSKKRGSQLKSLNAPSISRIQDYGTVIFPDETNRSKCIECKMMMSSTDHYKKYVHCTMCRFATSCSVAYAKHMMGFHSGQMSSLNMNIPWERPMKETMYCACGFKSSYGNKIANHLVFCGKWTCYSTKLQTSPEVASTSSSSAKVEEKKDGSLLGMLGLVSKDEVSPTEEEEGIISNKPRPESSKLSDTSVKKTAAIKVDKPKPKSKKLEAKLKEVENSGKSEKLSETGIEKSAEEDISNSMPDEIKETLTEKLKGTEEMDIDDAVKTGEKELEVETVDLTNREKDQKQDNDVIEILDESKATERKEDKTSAAMCEVEDAEDKSSEETRKDLDKEVCEVEETEEKSSKETRKDLDKETCAMEETEDKSREEARNDVEKDTSEEVSEDDQKGSVEKDLLNDDKIEKKIEMEVGEKVKDQDSDSKDTAVPQDAPEQMEVEVNASAVGDTKSDAPEIIQTPQSEEEVEETESKEDKSLSKGDSVADESVQKEDSGVDKGTEESSTKDTDGEMQNQKEMSIEDQKLETEENTEEAGKQPCDVETVEKVDIENIEDKSEAAKESEESKESDTIEQSKMTIPSEHGDLRDRERRESRSSDRSSSERVRRSSESERRSHERDRRSSDRDHHSSERERQHSGGRHDDHRQGNRPHHGSHRSDSYHGNRPYDRSHDRGQGHWQDNRGGYGGYHDNRGQGYRGGGGYRGQGGQFGGYQGNRGGHYQDRGRGGYQGNYNRNFQGRGGYNPNYRGGGYGGGYY